MTDRIDTAAERAKLAALEGHTQGPWRKHGNGRHVTSDTDLVALAVAGPIKHNTRLIAVAPDLLAVTNRLLDALDAERERAEKAEAERDEWIETARHHSKVVSAFLGWLRSAGEHMRAFGVTICDDGSDAGEVLAAKVPGCAKAMAVRITDLEAERDQALARLAAVRDEIDRLREALSEARAALNGENQK